MAHPCRAVHFKAIRSIPASASSPYFRLPQYFVGLPVVNKSLVHPFILLSGKPQQPQSEHLS